MGIKKRKFAAIPEDYYPASFVDIFIFTFLLIILIGSYFGAMISFLDLINIIGTSLFSQVVCYIFLLFLIVALISMYLGGKSKQKL
jgi:hypothetical protein